MSSSSFAYPKSAARPWRPVTLTEALLAVFAVGLLLGLWLGGVTGKREVRELRDLQRRIGDLELHRTRLETPFSSSPGHIPRNSSPETESELSPASVPAIRA